MSNPTGGHQLLEAAAASGVELCFANPGTTEMGLVAALDDPVARIRTSLVLFEGVATGAADGYARITGRPALTLLHLGPGFAYGAPNMHNARRAGSPMVTVVGDHTTEHVGYDSPLTSDIEGLARPVSVWVGSTGSSDTVQAGVRDAVQAARSPLTGPATLIVPADHQTSPASGLSEQDIAALRTWRPPAKPAPDPSHLEAVGRLLRTPGTHPVFYVGGDALSVECRDLVARLCHATGGRAWTGTSMPCIDRGGSRPELGRLPYFPDAAREALSDANPLVIVGTRSPVAFFGGDGVESDLTKGLETVVLADELQDCEAALAALVDAIPEPDASRARESRSPAGTPPAGGQLTGAAIGGVVASLLPENSIVSLEGSTCGHSFFEASRTAAPHSVLTNTGGAIGQGLPVALGAALGAPDRQVIALQSDGSAHYTMQTLWSLAREGTNTVVIIVANRRYAILEAELRRLGHTSGEVARGLTELIGPEHDWVALARGYGVPGQRVESIGDLQVAMKEALASEGPALIEAVV